jgi:hypothetical protein
MSTEFLSENLKRRGHLEDRRQLNQSFIEFTIQKSVSAQHRDVVVHSSDMSNCNGVILLLNNCSHNYKSTPLPYFHLLVLFQNLNLHLCIFLYSLIL